MTCRINEDDRCQHGVPVEAIDMHHCPHDGFRCTPCGHPDCHRVTARKIPGPLTKLLPVCALCGPVGKATDSDGIKEARAAHHKEVAK